MKVTLNNIFYFVSREKADLEKYEDISTSQLDIVMLMMEPCVHFIYKNCHYRWQLDKQNGYLQHSKMLIHGYTGILKDEKYQH